jgi:hypothetical protein
VANAEFAIDIAAKMAGGGQTVAELDSITAKLLGGGKNADFFSDAITKVGQQLTAAKDASAAANAALAEGNSEFAALERAAIQSSKALEKAMASGKADSLALLGLNANAAASSAALQTHTDKLRGLEAEAKKAADDENKLGQTMANLKTLNGHANKTLGEQAERLGKLQAGVSQLGGPIGGIASKFIGMAKGSTELEASLGATTAKMVVATTVAFAIAAALVIGAVKLGSYAIGLADARRNADLLSQAMIAQHPILAGLEGTTAGLTRETGMHADELQKLALKLNAAGVSAAQLPDALRAAALAETALGSGGADQFIADIQAGKGAVSDLAAATTSKFGGIVAQQMRGLGAQSKRLQDNLSGLFGGLNIDPVLDGFGRLVSAFDASTALGGTLKFVFEKVFQPLVDGVGGASILIEAFVLRLAIWGLKAYLAFRPYGEAFETLGVALGAAGVAATLFFIGTLVPGAIAAVAAMLPVAAAALAAAAPFLALGAVVAGVYLAFTHWDQIVPFVTGIFAQIPELAQNLILGLVGGIIGGGPAVLKALGGVVGGAIDYAKSLLGIHSPSTVFAAIGDNTIAGNVNALEAGAPDVAAAMGNVVSGGIDEAHAQAEAGAALPPTIPAVSAAPASSASPAGAAAAPGAAAKAGATVTGNTFIFNGVAGAEDAEERFGDLLTRFFEGDAAEVGAT